MTHVWKEIRTWLYQFICTHPRTYSISYTAKKSNKTTWFTICYVCEKSVSISDGFQNEFSKNVKEGNI